MTFKELQTQAIRRLKEAPPPRSPENFDSPQWDVRLLTEYASGLNQTQLLLAADEKVPENVKRRFNRFLRRRLAGVPVAYITKSRCFFGLDLEVTPAVLVPRSETETLAEAVIESGDKNKPLRVLDLCTGSGCIAAAVKNSRPRWTVYASDISAAALKVARRNFRRLGLEVTVFKRDLMKNLPGQYDIIAANPPYISLTEMENLKPDLYEPEPALTDGGDGLSLIFRILSSAPAKLNPGGRLLLEAAPHQTKIIRAKMEELCYTETGVLRDAAGRERIVYGNHYHHLSI